MEKHFRQGNWYYQVIKEDDYFFVGLFAKNDQLYEKYDFKFTDEKTATGVCKLMRYAYNDGFTDA